MPIEKTIWDYLPSITALVAVIVGPLVSLYVTRQQLKKQQKISDEQLRANRLLTTRYKEIQEFKRLVVEVVLGFTAAQTEMRVALKDTKERLEKGLPPTDIPQKRDMMASYDKLHVTYYSLMLTLDEKNKLQSEFKDTANELLLIVEDSIIENREWPDKASKLQSKMLLTGRMIVEEQIGAIENM